MIIDTVWPLLALPIFWVGISFTLGMFGWRHLAHSYPAERTSQGRTWYMEWGQIGLTHYRAALILTATMEGLRIAVLFPFRIGHPPIFIPWEDLSAVRDRWTFIPVVHLVAAKVPSVRIKLSKRTAIAIAAAVGEAWPGRIT
jgi:hypothetical protein